MSGVDFFCCLTTTKHNFTNSMIKKSCLNHHTALILSNKKSNQVSKFVPKLLHLFQGLNRNKWRTVDVKQELSHKARPHTHTCISACTDLWRSGSVCWAQWSLGSRGHWLQRLWTGTICWLWCQPVGHAPLQSEGQIGEGGNHRGQGSHRVTALCEFVATSVVRVFLFAKLSKTLWQWGMCNSVQQSLSAVQHFHSCSMWHAGTCKAKIS